MSQSVIETIRFSVKELNALINLDHNALQNVTLSMRNSIRKKCINMSELY